MRHIGRKVWNETSKWLPLAGDAFYAEIAEAKRTKDESNELSLRVNNLRKLQNELNEQVGELEEVQSNDGSEE